MCRHYSLEGINGGGDEIRLTGNDGYVEFPERLGHLFYTDFLEPQLAFLKQLLLMEAMVLMVVFTLLA